LFHGESVFVVEGCGESGSAGFAAEEGDELLVWVAIGGEGVAGGSGTEGDGPAVLVLDGESDGADLLAAGRAGRASDKPPDVVDEFLVDGPGDVVLEAGLVEAFGSEGVADDVVEGEDGLGLKFIGPKQGVGLAGGESASDVPREAEEVEDERPWVASATADGGVQVGSPEGLDGCGAVMFGLPGHSVLRLPASLAFGG
jgi:hypothetical protein